MKLKKKKGILSVSVLAGICILTGCAGNTAASVQNGTLLSVMPTSGNGSTAKDSSTVEIPGSVDFSVYEAYGLSFDERKGCYTYNGDIVRFFNDPVAGASFTNFFTGTVDIEAKRDVKNHLIGIEQCTQEVYDRHTQKHEYFQNISIGTEPHTAMEVGTGQGNEKRRKDEKDYGVSYAMEAGTGQSDVEWLKEYEDYGVSYHSQDGSWYYGGDEIRILLDSERGSVYFADQKGVCLAVNRDENHNITEIKSISESDAWLLLQANNPNAAGDFTTEEN